nr:MAG TPA: hypothetical protein [Caudoviricetes sp.]
MDTGLFYFLSLSRNAVFPRTTTIEAEDHRSRRFLFCFKSSLIPSLYLILHLQKKRRGAAGAAK